MAYVRSTSVDGVVDHQVVADHEVVDRQVAERTVVREPFSWAQPVAFVVGGLFLVLGAVALARTGVSAENLTQPHVGVAGLDHTPLLGIIEVAVGLMLVIAGAMSGARRGLMIFLGGVSTLFGIITLIEPDPFHDSLGMHAANSWLFMVTGIVTLLAGAFAAVHHRGDQLIVRTRDVVADEIVAAPPRY